MSTNLTGSVLHDTHRIVRLIGQGGMGAVYEAEHVRLSNKRFAVKVLHTAALQASGVYARFRREAEIATSLGHPNIIDVTDFYETDHGPCMVMELLHGDDLEAVIGRRGRLRAAELAPVLAQVGSALQAAHDRGVVHRDLKPANIFLSSPDGDGVTVKLLDFGISKIRDSNTQLTGARDVLGTPHYMSPEQGSGEVADVDQSTDVFSLGIICFQALSGTLPFDAPTLLGVIYKICNEEPPPLAELVPTCTEPVAQAVHRAMAKDKAQRYQRVEDFVGELGEALSAIEEPEAPGSPSLAGSLALLARGASPAAAGELALAPTLDPHTPAPSRGDAGRGGATGPQTTFSAAAGETRARTGTPRAGLVAPLLVAGLALVGGLAAALIYSGADRDAVDRLAAGAGVPARDAALNQRAPAGPADHGVAVAADVGVDVGVDSAAAVAGHRLGRRARRARRSSRRRPARPPATKAPPRDGGTGKGFNEL